VTLRSYLRLLLVLTAIDVFLLTSFYVLSPADIVVRGWLFAKLLLDMFFVATNLRQVRLSQAELLFLALLIAHLVIGFSVLPSISGDYGHTRALRDCIPVGLFFLKVSIIRNFFRDGKESESLLSWLRGPLLALSLAQIALFFLLNRGGGAYAGITPPVTLPFAFAVAGGGLLSVGLLAGLAALSGKRAIVLSFLVVYVAVLVQRRKFTSLATGLCAIGVLIAVASVGGWSIADKVVASWAIVPLAAEHGLLTLLDPDPAISSALSFATAGRSDEWIPLVTHMSPLTFVTGLGAGFTYDYTLYDGVEVMGYANAHFSPLALVYKFGFVFCMGFYLYVVRATRSGSNAVTNTVADVARVGVWVIVLQSFFSYNLFVESLLPVLLAAAQQSKQSATRLLKNRSSS
jgi:hypothetical protein